MMTEEKKVTVTIEVKDEGEVKVQEEDNKSKKQILTEEMPLDL